MEDRQTIARLITPKEDWDVVLQHDEKQRNMRWVAVQDPAGHRIFTVHNAFWSPSKRPWLRGFGVRMCSCLVLQCDWCQSLPSNLRGWTICREHRKGLSYCRPKWFFDEKGVWANRILIAQETHLTQTFNLTLTNSVTDRNGTFRIAIMVEASRFRGPSSPAGTISI